MTAPDATFFLMRELTALSGVDKPSIHYYLTRGYLHSPTYKKGNRAIYDQTHVDKLRFLKKNREKGIPLPYACELWERRAKPGGSSSRKVRRAAEGAATRQDIVEVATRSFLAKGYHNATISEIMEDVGSSKESFYYYFENKKDLYFACLDNIFQDVFRDALDDIRDEEDMIARLEMRWGATRAFFPEMTNLLQLVRESLRDEDEEHRRQAAAILRRSLIEPLAGDLDKGMQDGVFRRVRSEIVPFALLSMLEMVAYRYMIDERYSDADIEDSVLDLILHGLLKT